jgi:DNA-binding HxlR family transcriptional regulator
MRRNNQVAALNKIIHERARLLILTYLTSNQKKEISFNELQENLEFSSGNLSIQLKKLKEAGYQEAQRGGVFKHSKNI